MAEEICSLKKSVSSGGTTDGLILLTSGGTGVVHAAQDNLTYSTGYYLGIACVVTNRSTIRGTNTTSCNVTLIKDDFTQNNAVSKSGNWSIDVTDYAYVTINAGNSSNSGKISLS
jgi:hypothetical protein